MLDDALLKTATLGNVHFSLIAESIPHIVWLASPEGKTEYINAQGADYLGCVAGIQQGRDWLAFVHPADVERARTAWTVALRSLERFDTEYRVRRSDGQYRWHVVRGRPLYGAGHDLLKWIGTATDIEEHKLVQHDLRQSQRQSEEALTILETLQSTSPVGFAFIDRECRIVRINEKLASVNGGSVASQLGRTVAEVIPGLWPQLEPIYRHVFDTGEPVVNHEISGAEFVDPSEENFWLTSHYPVRIGSEIIGLGVVVVDITQRHQAERAQDDLTRAAIAAIAATVEARDPYTAGHQRRVARISAAIAAEIGLDAHAIEGIRLAAEIHDIGKVRIPSEILSRPSQLRRAEFDLVKSHSRDGHDIVAGIKFRWPIAEMILQHHERHDGSGYPDGIAGDRILIGARIIGVADVVEAMASHRPYRAALGLDAALDEIRNGCGTRYDPVVANACLTLFREGRIQLDEVS